MKRVVLRLGKWLAQVGEAIYGTRAGPWEPVDNQYGFTMKPGHIYVHLLAGYQGGTFTTPPVKGRVVRCAQLHNEQELDFTTQDDGRVMIKGIDRTLHPVCTVVDLRLE